MNGEVKTTDVLKHPAAFLPMAMSCAALALVLVHLARLGVTHEADEGAAAHVWQLLMAAQIPIAGFFVIRWFGRAPRVVLWVLVLQAAAALVAIAPVYFLRL